MPRTGTVFVRPRGGRFSGNRLSVVIAAYLREHGIDATAHQLLHWFATEVYASSKDIRVTQELLVTRTRPRQRDTWRTAMWTLLLRSRHSLFSERLRPFAATGG